jgi:hypothetical protein
MLSRGRARHRATFQMYRVAVLLPERFRGGCSFGANTLRVSVSSNDVQSVSYQLLLVKLGSSVVERRGTTDRDGQAFRSTIEGSARRLRRVSRQTRVPARVDGFSGRAPQLGCDRLDALLDRADSTTWLGRAKCANTRSQTHIQAPAPDRYVLFLGRFASFVECSGHAA